MFKELFEKLENPDMWYVYEEDEAAGGANPIAEFDNEKDAQKYADKMNKKNNDFVYKIGQE